MENQYSDPRLSCMSVCRRSSGRLRPSPPTTASGVRCACRCAQLCNLFNLFSNSARTIETWLSALVRTEMRCGVVRPTCPSSGLLATAHTDTSRGNNKGYQQLHGGRTDARARDISFARHFCASRSSHVHAHVMCTNARTSNDAHAGAREQPTCTGTRSAQLSCEGGIHKTTNRADYRHADARARCGRDCASVLVVLVDVHTRYISYKTLFWLSYEDSLRCSPPPPPPPTSMGGRRDCVTTERRRWRRRRRRQQQTHYSVVV